MAVLLRRRVRDGGVPLPLGREHDCGLSLSSACATPPAGADCVASSRPQTDEAGEARRPAP
jgi:hypothetical protein